MYVNSVKMHHVMVSSKSHQETEQEEGRHRGDGGKIKWKLSEVICIEDRING
jgi:hypothetical protein